jgi:hypothetical protein
LDDDDSCAGGLEAVLIGGDVVDGVGCGLGRVDLDGVHGRAVDVGGDAEVEVGLRPLDDGAENGRYGKNR